ncbi:MAG: M1 family metallopeptidase [Cyclobacteriaceae bacterium]|nr:M1 family metallopeptidase [Cyclobacteriaceae bacterium]
MKNLTASVILSVCLFIPVAGHSDSYPKNFGIDIQHYQFRLWLSDKNDSLRAEATLIVNFRKSGITVVRLDLTGPNSDLQGKGMTVARVTSEGNLLSFSHRSNELLITTPTSAVGQQLSITVTYHGIPDAGLAVKRNRYNDRTFFSDNWPDLGHHWLPLVDHPYDKATCEFIVTAPSHYQVVSNGLLQEESILANGNKLTHWKQSVPIAPWLFVLGVADFAVQYVDNFQGKSIQTWVYWQDRYAGFYDFQTPSKQALSFFSDYVGPFAYEKLANIQSNNSTGGMEAASAIMYSEKSVTGKRDARWQSVIVHEIAHQWFGDAVTERDWDDVWLSEGFATYFTLLYEEHSKGRDEFADGLKSSREQIINYLQKNRDSPVVHNQLSDMSQVTSTLTYQKGAWILHMLRDMIGDTNFRKGIQSYYRRYFNANASTTDFRFEMEQASGLDLRIFFSQWLNQAGMPKIKGQWSWDSKHKELKINLAQTQTNSYSFPLEIGIVSAGRQSPEIKKVTMNTKQSTISFPLETRPATVIIDPRTVLLAEFDFEQK